MVITASYHKSKGGYNKSGTVSEEIWVDHLGKSWFDYLEKSFDNFCGFISCLRAFELSRRATRAPLKRRRWQSRTLTRAMAGTRQRTSTTTWRVSSVRSPSSSSPSSSSSASSPSGDYGQELEKKKFTDKDKTDYYDSLEFCADLVWNG